MFENEKYIYLIIKNCFQFYVLKKNSLLVSFPLSIKGYFFVILSLKSPFYTYFHILLFNKFVIPQDLGFHLFFHVLVVLLVYRVIVVVMV